MVVVKISIMKKMINILNLFFILNLLILYTQIIQKELLKNQVVIF